MKEDEDCVGNDNDLMFYQRKNVKAWCGPVKVFTVKGDSIWVIDLRDKESSKM